MSTEKNLRRWWETKEKANLYIRTGCYWLQVLVWKIKWKSPHVTGTLLDFLMRWGKKCWDYDKYYDFCRIVTFNAIFREQHFSGGLWFNSNLHFYKHHFCWTAKFPQFLTTSFCAWSTLLVRNSFITAHP